MSIWPDGEGHAWHNARGFAPMPWDNVNLVVVTGFADVAVLRFADLDGDHRADALAIDPDRQIRAWHNGSGYAATPWDDAATVAIPNLP